MTKIENLGCYYSKNKCCFRLWAPTYNSCSLYLEINGVFRSFLMKKDKDEVFEVEVEGDYLNCSYYYSLINNGKAIKCNDPYGKGVSLDSKYSAVVDFENVALLKSIKFKPYTDRPVIYELNVRDFTDDEHSLFKNKGKYLGLIEEGVKTKAGTPAGIDYLKLLGVDYIQLQPVIDFYGVNDKDDSLYNWGYNPLNFYALEGSYSLKPEIPNERLYELRKVVDAYHKNNIGVILDVVYNHIYEYENSSLELSNPGYYFRKDKNQMCNASGCGNDFASEKDMARQMILDSISYLLKTFDIDGFRLDLMGLIDIETIKEAYKVALSIKPNVLIYGEGWNMDDILPYEQRSSLNNAHKLPSIGFFNDFYRETIKNFCLRTSYNKENVLDAITGSLNMFENENQTINYLECHDDMTLFDQADYSDQVLELIQFCNKVLLVSNGTAFIHMGQEFGMSKKGMRNTYNVKNINTMNWSLVDERLFMSKNAAKYIKLRKFLQKNFNSNYKSEFWNNDVICLYTKNTSGKYKYKELIILINPLDTVGMYGIPEFERLSLTSLTVDKNYDCSQGRINPKSIQILVK